jgi:hypothetical protein
MSVEPSAAAQAIAAAILPSGEFLRSPGRAALCEMYAELATIHPRAPRLLESLCAALDAVALVHTGRRLERLASERRTSLVERWYASSGGVSALVTAVAYMLKLTFFGRREIHDHFGVPHDKAPPVPEPAPPHMKQAVRGAELAGEALESDVVVVGSGAAGAIVAKELAQRGHAVLLVEAGRYFRRHHFSGQFLQASRDCYWWGLHNIALGNVLIPVPAGRTVGGSTTINTATCFRPPRWVFRRWVDDGLPELAEERLAPYFADVEATLQIAPVKRELWGRHVELMAAFLDRRGLRHAPIRRNAPECDGQNCCDMGCPSGGKLSLDLSYVPMALRHGALLLTETALRRVLIRDRRVRGVELESGGRRFQAAARRVVLACGALATPRVLWEHDLGGPAVGRNLTIHPAPSVSARFAEPLRGFGQLVPSSHFIDEFHDRGILLISANLPLDMGAMPLQLVGHELIDQMEHYDEFGTWGVLLAESGRGRLHRLPGGSAACSYFMPDADVERLQWALATICELYLEAGARACFPSVRGFPVVRDAADLDRFRRTRLRAGQLQMSAYHPLGTCRMGRDQKSSVVDPEHRLHGIEGLSIVDGSVIPGPIGVNSQLTVMAFARRAAEILARQLEEG